MGVDGLRRQSMGSADPTSGVPVSRLAHWLFSKWPLPSVSSTDLRGDTIKPTEAERPQPATDFARSPFLSNLPAHPAIRP
jgi:hypothetical protein